MTNTTTPAPIVLPCHGGCGFNVTIPMARGGEAAAERMAANRQFEAHLDRCPAEKIRRENMSVVHDYAGPTGAKRWNVNPETRARIDAAVWALQDGYGVAGFTPAQGWDWSGIRDSQAATVEAMARAIRRIVGLDA